MIKDQETHRQTIVALFGQMNKERDSTITAAGYLDDKANEWARQLERDLLTMNNTEEGEALFKQISPTGSINFKKLFGETSDDF